MGGQLVLSTVLTLVGVVVVVAFLVQGRSPRRSRVLAAARRATHPSALRRGIDRVVGRWRLVRQIRETRRRRSLQRISADLRRLRRLIVADAADSAVHQFAHKMAYDQLMVEACTMLALTHGLGPEVTGRDRELERYRAEAMLQDAGVVLEHRTSTRYTDPPGRAA